MQYADKVARGYRPARPKMFPQPVWELVESCWSADPVARLHMSEVVAALEVIVKELEGTKGKCCKVGKAQVTPAATGGRGSGSATAARASPPSAAPASTGCSCVIC